MSWNSEYKEEEIVKDHTKPLKKIWDNLMPTSYPYVIEFNTNKVVEVKQLKKMGPYSMNEHFIDYDCSAIIDSKPLVDLGWNGGPISNELAKKAYGELYFHDFRLKMNELMKYAGLNFSNFDSGGNIDAKASDIL